jgi:hypothetical protein
MMRNVLVIGCGGSGAKTLSHMMDQLRADLAPHGITDLPGCWQFVTVDTPLQEEHGKDLPSVGQAGGSYVACGENGSYAGIDAALTQRLQTQDLAGLRATATWMPDSPSDVTFPISVGAGQYRGIGRLLTLSKISQIRPGVHTAIRRMADPSSREQAARVAKALDLGKVPDAGDPVIPIVISSMAGGSGASMTLDVCRILGAVPGVDMSLAGIFLYTADVFGALPADQREGMAGNTLAMLGEILSAQATAGGGVTGRTDAALYRTLGVEGSGDRPFRRVFPVGRHAGDGGMVFGDGTADGVFRGMGRGIGRLLTSPRFDDLVQYFIGNGAATTATIGEVGWGSAPDNIAWGSFGFASLSTGRDRYTEYAAERIARRSLDHVLDGFRRAGSTQAHPPPALATSGPDDGPGPRRRCDCAGLVPVRGRCGPGCSVRRRAHRGRRDHRVPAPGHGRHLAERLAGPGRRLGERSQHRRGHPPGGGGRRSRRRLRPAPGDEPA